MKLSNTGQIPSIGPIWRARVAALAEVLVVLAIANIVSVLANRALGISSFREEIKAVPFGELPNYYTLALISAGQLFFKWGIMFGLAYLIGRWHRNRRLSDYGVSKGGGSLGSYLTIGIVAGLIIAFPSDFLVQVDIYMNGSTDLVASADAGRGTMRDNRLLGSRCSFSICSSCDSRGIMDERICANALRGRLWRRNINLVFRNHFWICTHSLHPV